MLQSLSHHPTLCSREACTRCFRARLPRRLQSGRDDSGSRAGHIKQWKRANDNGCGVADISARRAFGDRQWPVRWRRHRHVAIASGGGMLSAPTAISDSLGNAKVTYTAGTVAGTVTINAAYGATSGIAFTATVVSSAPATIGIVSGDLQNGPINTTLLLPLVVQVNDRYGNPSLGTPIVWSLVGGGTLSATNTTTDARGRAQVTVAAGPTSGVRTIQASAANIGAANFSATITN